ncbi:MAG TPA: hypothetical protein VNQ55_07200 [Parapedobacter sp.]|nr:hypothetical protein [Parapedobacter sp.]
MSTPPFIPTQQLLKTATTAAPFSEAFSNFCVCHHWQTVGDILRIPLAQLLEIPGYLQQCHEELMTFLQAHRRNYLLHISG